MDIAEILKNVPKGTKLYSPIFGEVELNEVDSIFIYIKHDDFIARFHSDGKYTKNGECVLFPSRENRDWNTFKKFNINILKPFDKVLVRYSEDHTWTCNLFSYYNDNNIYYKYRCLETGYIQCVPYNDETKHLVGTKEPCPEYYKTW